MKILNQISNVIYMDQIILTYTFPISQTHFPQGKEIFLTMLRGHKHRGKGC